MAIGFKKDKWICGRKLMSNYIVLKRFHHDEKGSLVVEFALIGPILIMAFMAMIEFGMAFFTLSSIQQASWQAARQVATGQIRADEVLPFIQKQIPSWAQAGASIPTATLANGIYTVSVSLKLSDASPLKFTTALYGSNVVSVKASFQSELN